MSTQTELWDDFTRWKWNVKLFGPLIHIIVIQLFTVSVVFSNIWYEETQFSSFIPNITGPVVFNPLAVLHRYIFNVIVGVPFVIFYCQQTRYVSIFFVWHFIFRCYFFQPERLQRNILIGFTWISYSNWPLNAFFLPLVSKTAK